jgi:phage terminase large subunit-like protein
VPKPKTLSFTDLTRTLSERIRLQATRPNIYGYTPHEKQVRFHSAPEKGRLYVGGNRSGKTTGGVVEDIWWLTGKHPFLQTPPPPVYGRSICVDFLNGIEKIIRPEVARWLPLSEIKGGSWSTGYNKELRTLTCENGSTLEFMSYDQQLDKFAGTSRHFIHFDEEPPKDIYTENRARLIDTAGSYWITMTPVLGMDWVYDDLYIPGKNNGGSNIAVIEVDMTENPYLSQGEIEEFISGLSADERTARVRGNFVRVGGLVFKFFDPDIHVMDPFIPPKSWEWYVSLDHGYNNPTAIYWHAVSPDNQVVTFSEAYDNEHTVDYWASLIHTRNTMLGRPPDYYVADPAIAQRQAVTGASIQTEYAQLGINFMLGHNDVVSGINRMTQHLKVNVQTGKPNWIITRNCQNLIWEMQRLRWKTWRTTKLQAENNPHDAVHKKDDHGFDSCRYFFTVIPDLRPSPNLVVPNRNGSLIPGAVTPVVIESMLDPNLLKIESVNVESTGYIDEHLGGIW